jgi:hypothetical protein
MLPTVISCALHCHTQRFQHCCCCFCRCIHQCCAFIGCTNLGYVDHNICAVAASLRAAALPNTPLPSLLLLMPLHTPTLRIRWLQLPWLC